MAGRSGNFNFPSDAFAEIQSTYVLEHKLINYEIPMALLTTVERQTYGDLL